MASINWSRGKTCVTTSSRKANGSAVTAPGWLTLESKDAVGNGRADCEEGMDAGLQTDDSYENKVPIVVVLVRGAARTERIFKASFQHPRPRLDPRMVNSFPADTSFHGVEAQLSTQIPRWIKIPFFRMISIPLKMESC